MHVLVLLNLATVASNFIFNLVIFFHFQKIDTIWVIADVMSRNKKKHG